MLPARPLLARSSSAVPAVCSANAEFPGIPDEPLVDVVPVDEPVELPLALDAEAGDAFEELKALEASEELEGGTVG